MITRKLEVHDYVYHLLRSQRQGLITLDNADERLQQCTKILGLDESFDDAIIGKFYCAEEDCYLETRISSSFSLSLTAVAVAATFPDSYVEGKGDKYEVEVTWSSEQEQLLKLIAKHLKMCYDNDFIERWLLGNAIINWEVGSVHHRKITSSLPVGAYGIQIDVIDIGRTLYFPPKDLPIVLSEDRQYAFWGDEKITLHHRNELHEVMVTNANQKDRSGESVDSKKSKGVKDKLSNDKAKKSSGISMS